MVDLETTNVLLGIMAAVSVLEALLLMGLGVGGLIGYRRVMTLVNELERRQVAPLTAKVDAILADVQSVTRRMQAQATRVDSAIHGTLARVDSTAAGVKDAMRDRVDQVVAVVRGVRAVVASLFGRDVSQVRV